MIISMQRSAGVYRFPLLAKTDEFDPGSKEMHVLAVTYTYSYPIAGEKCSRSRRSIPYFLYTFSTVSTGPAIRAQTAPGISKWTGRRPICMSVGDKPVHTRENALHTPVVCPAKLCGYWLPHSSTNRRGNPSRVACLALPFLLVFLCVTVV